MKLETSKVAMRTRHSFGGLLGGVSILAVSRRSRPTLLGKEKGGRTSLRGALAHKLFKLGTKYVAGEWLRDKI